MIFRQVIHEDLGCASYLIGDLDARTAAVVDPRFEIDEYLRLARYLDVAIDHVLETHNHADHVSGHGRLAAATGAVIHIHRDAAVGYPHQPFEDGWELRLGRVTVRALHTPGHRPEHTAFALVDRARGPDPWALLTGDTLFVGDIARPDLAVERREGARGIFRSLHERLLVLAPETEVWPGHLGGSLCGGPAMDMKVCSTIGFERARNDLLRETDVERFVDRAIATLGPQPPRHREIVELNRGPLLVRGAELAPLTPRQLELRLQDGALGVDVRTDLQFDEAHIPGSLSIPAHRAGFGTRLAWLAGPGQEVVLVGRDDEDARAAGALALAVGVRSLGGFLAGGMTSWRQDRRPTLAVERVGLRELPERLRRQPELQVLDVRERAEWDAGHIPGSAHRPWHDLDGVPEELDPAGAIAVICASGERAGVAAGLLQRLGARRVVHVVDGGVPAWRRLGEPVHAPGAA